MIFSKGWVTSNYRGQKKNKTSPCRWAAFPDLTKSFIGREIFGKSVTRCATDKCGWITSMYFTFTSKYLFITSLSTTFYRPSIIYQPSSTHPSSMLPVRHPSSVVHPPSSIKIHQHPSAIIHRASSIIHDPSSRVYHRS